MNSFPQPFSILLHELNRYWARSTRNRAHQETTSLIKARQQSPDVNSHLKQPTNAIRRDCSIAAAIAPARCVRVPHGIYQRWLLRSGRSSPRTPANKTGWPEQTLRKKEEKKKRKENSCPGVIHRAYRNRQRRLINNPLSVCFIRNKVTIDLSAPFPPRYSCTVRVRNKVNGRHRFVIGT